jgi:hypothetical protein
VSVLGYEAVSVRSKRREPCYQLLLVSDKWVWSGWCLGCVSGTVSALTTVASLCNATTAALRAGCAAVSRTLSCDRSPTSAMASASSSAGMPHAVSAPATRQLLRSTCAMESR